MVLDLVEKLSEKVIELINYQKKVKKSLFDNQIEPIFNQLESVHASYIDSFRKYYDCIKDNEFDIGGYPFKSFRDYPYRELIRESREHPIFEMILMDSLFTMNDRDKLRYIAASTKDKRLGDFIRSIYEYLSYAIDDSREIFFGYPDTHNGARYFACGGIYKILFSDLSAKERKDGSLKVINQVTKDCQDKYSNVVKEYYKLKSELID